MKFLLTGDDQLGAGAHLGREPGERLYEQAENWRQRVALAVEEGCEALVYAGDAFERRRPTPEEMRAFEGPLVNARALGLPVLAIVGNHDVEHAARATGLDVFADAGLLTLHRLPGVEVIGDTSFVTLPWTPASQRLAAADAGVGRDELDEHSARLLVRAAAEIFPQLRARWKVLLAHWAISDAAVNDLSGHGGVVLHEPVLDRRALEEIGYDAIVAGHLHAPQIFYADDGDRPTVIVGSPMPNNFGEAGYIHGCWILEDGHAEFVPMPTRALVTLDIDCDNLSESEADLRRVRDAIVRVRLHATPEQARHLEQAQIRRLLLENGAYHVSQVTVELEREDVARNGSVLEDGLGELEQFAAYLAANEINGTHAARLIDLTAGYLERA